MKLSVCMITYNHEKFIAQAINSVLIQQTNFDYGIVIGEDCSTDNTRSICLEYQRKYPDKIRLLLPKKNLGMIHNFIQTFGSCRGKYVAMLEGDDYWTDPYKLQKQVDFLEANPDYGLVHSDYNKHYLNHNKLEKAINKLNRRDIPRGYVFEELLLRNFISTPTTCWRRLLIQNSQFLHNLSSCQWSVGDWALWLEISAQSYIGYLDEPMATYRIHKKSLTHINRKHLQYKFMLSMYELRLHYISIYEISDETKHKFYCDYYDKLLKCGYYLKNSDLIKSAYKYLKCNSNNTIQIVLDYIGSTGFVLWLLARIYQRIGHHLLKIKNKMNVITAL